MAVSKSQKLGIQLGIAGIVVTIIVGIATVYWPTSPPKNVPKEVPRRQYTGVVTDADGHPLRGGEVQLIGEGPPLTVPIDEHGTYVFPPTTLPSNVTVRVFFRGKQVYEQNLSPMADTTQKIILDRHFDTGEHPSPSPVTTPEPKRNETASPKPPATDASVGHKTTAPQQREPDQRQPVSSTTATPPPPSPIDQKKQPPESVPPEGTTTGISATLPTTTAPVKPPPPTNVEASNPVKIFVEDSGIPSDAKKLFDKLEEQSTTACLRSRPFQVEDRERAGVILRCLDPAGLMQNPMVIRTCRTGAYFEVAILSKATGNLLAGQPFNMPTGGFGNIESAASEVCTFLKSEAANIR